MLIRKSSDIPSSEITPKPVYLNRRNFMRGSLALGAAALAGDKLYRAFTPEAAQAGAKLQFQKSGYSTSEKLTSLKDVTHYNNFYEFSTDKDGPAKLAGSFQPLPWSVSVEGLVQKPKSYDMDALLKLAPLEERIYRLRCVEGWSRADQAGGANFQGAVRRVHHGASSQPDARPKARGARLALCRRLAPR
jgi:sulfoxide reductase catalytic subunit YedY